MRTASIRADTLIASCFQTDTNERRVCSFIFKLPATLFETESDTNAYTPVTAGFVIAVEQPYSC